MIRSFYVCMYDERFFFIRTDKIIVWLGINLNAYDYAANYANYITCT